MSEGTTDPMTNTRQPGKPGRPRSAFVFALLALALMGLPGVLSACSGGDEGTAPAPGGSPQSTSSTIDPVAAKEIRNNRAPDSCVNYRSNEEICADFNNYLLSYRPIIESDKDYETRGPYLIGSGKFTPVGSKEGVEVNSYINFEDVGKGAGDDGQHRGYNSQAKKPFGDFLQVDFNDQASIGNSGSVRIKATAGDVDLGTAHFWLRNEDGADDDDQELGYKVDGDNDWFYCEAKRGGGGGPVLFSCGAMNRPTKGVDVCVDNGDDEECGFTFYLQTYPVRVNVQNKLPGSKLEITKIEDDQPDGTSDFDFEVSEWASSLKPGTSAEEGRALWLAGYRAQAGGKVKVTGVLRPLTAAAKTEAWANQNIVMESTWGQVKVVEEKDGKKQEVVKQPDPTCTIGASSSGSKAGCDVDLTIGRVSNPGTATFVIQK